MSLSQSFSQKIGNVRPLNPCPSLDIDFANGGYVTDLGFADQASVGSANFNIGAFNGPDPIFTRATAATFRGSNGLIQYAPENLLQYSEQFDNPYWTVVGVSISQDTSATTDPAGGNTADKWRETAGGTAHALRRSLSVTSGTVYAFSVYAKSAENSYIGLFGIKGSVGKFFNLSNGTVGGNIGSSPLYYGIESAGNGWYRCWIADTENATTSRNFDIYSSKNGTNWDYSGTLNDGIYIWGAQLERSSTARPYISTTTTARYGPRFEHDLSGNPLGLLMEEQSQNLLSYSEQFNDASWIKNNLNTTGTPAWVNIAIAPDGNQTADKLIEALTATNVGHGFDKVFNVTNGSTYCASIYVKPAERTRVMIGCSGNGPTGFRGFDLSNGTTFSVVGGSLVNPLYYDIKPVGAGWYRISVADTATATGTRKFEILSISSGATFQYQGDGVSGFYIWGVQLEQKPFATSYIPTVGGTSTRNADVVSSTISSWFNQPEGTIVVSGDRSHSPSLNTSLYDSFYEFGDGGGGYHSAHFSDGTAEEFFGDNGAYATSAVGITTIGTFTSIASSYSSNDIYTTRDGITPNSAASATFAATPTTLNIGYSQAVTQAWNGHIKTFRYYPKALPDKLQRLSS